MNRQDREGGKGKFNRQDRQGRREEESVTRRRGDTDKRGTADRRRWENGVFHAPLGLISQG
jgi:hypothetical protein